VRASEVIWEKEVETGSGETRATNDVDEIVVGEVHCGPIKDPCVSPNKSRRVWEEMGEEEGFEGSIACV